jgi:hypothetical protein
MVNHSKLEKNLEALRQSLPKKPAVYTTDFPLMIAEALTKYANQKTVNSFGIAVYSYNEHGWPVPLYVDNRNIRVGFVNNIFRRKQTASTIKAFRRLERYKHLKKITFWNAQIRPWDWVNIPIHRNIHWKQSVDRGVMEMFSANINLVKTKFRIHPYLADRQAQLEEIFAAYRHKNWGPCINSIYPLLDSVARQVLDTDSLKKDMQSLCKLFRQIGIDKTETNVFMAVTNAVMVGEMMRAGEISKQEGEELQQKGYKHHLYLIGPALSSFLQFSHRYYGDYLTPSNPGDPLNRHGIMHGSYTQYATKPNAVRLLTYLYLILELDPVFKLLFKE